MAGEDLEQRHGWPAVIRNYRRLAEKEIEAEPPGDVDPFLSVDVDPRHLIRLIDERNAALRKLDAVHKVLDGEYLTAPIDALREAMGEE